MEIRILISVPQMWIPPSNQKMTLAAKLAGIVNATLVYEPQCAAAFIARTIQYDTQIPRPRIGDVFLVCDPGGGTGDFISYRVLGRGTSESDVSLSNPPERQICG